MRKELFLFVLLAIVLATGIASATPGLVVGVTPVKDTVLPGETATYNVTVASIATITEHVTLSISNPTSGWVYTFDPVEFDIEPDEIVLSTLSMNVPSDAAPGEYYHDMKASGEFLGVEIESSVYTNILTTVIPEFTTIAIPVAAILGLIFLFNRRRRG